MLATGWNTEEYESFLDFRYWMTQLTDDFKKQGKRFKPLFIGIAWESEWTGFADLGLEFLSFGNKGNDADAIGFTWGNYLLNDVLKPIIQENPDIKLVAIGHSFGSRIVLGSHYVRDVINRDGQTNAHDTTPVTLIGLQAAFPTGRFILKEHPYNFNYKEPATVVITSSNLDKATNMIDFATTGYIGGTGGTDEILQHEKLYKKTLRILDTDVTGQPLDHPDKNLVSVYNARPFVNCELPGTSSGAHSDVYDKEMGHFLGEIIRSIPIAGN